MSELAAKAPLAIRSGAVSFPRDVTARWLLALVAGLALIHLSMATARAINWDEFWFYSQVEELARGELVKPLQTIHARAFYWWLPDIGGTSVDHILIARFVMLGCLLVVATCIFLVAENFSDRRTALLAVAAYLGSGFVIHHGTAFRVDPIVTALLAASLAVAARTQLRWPSIVALGVMIGLAAMVTIKFVLWAPAFAGLALWRWQDEGWDKTYPLRWIAAGVVAGGTFAAIYLWHTSDLAEQSVAEAATRTLSHSADRMFGFLHSPHLDVAIKGASISPVLVVAAALVVVRVATMTMDWTRRASILGMWFPLLTPVFYYNSYPYFYVFILPPVAIACAFSIPLITARYGQTLLASLIGLSALGVWAVDERGVAGEQQRLIETVQKIAPFKVNYFDCCGLMGSYPKANPFLTRWGVASYQSAGRPLLLETLQEKPVPLLIDNGHWFFPLSTTPNELHPEDEAALRETFVQYWGNVYLAGRRLDRGKTLEWNVLVPGTYTVRGTIEIADNEYQYGDLVELVRGKVTLRNTGDESALLVWGDDPFEPSEAPPEKLWTGF